MSKENENLSAFMGHVEDVINTTNQKSTSTSTSTKTATSTKSSKKYVPSPTKSLYNDSGGVAGTIRNINAVVAQSVGVIAAATVTHDALNSPTSQLNLLTSTAVPPVSPVRSSTKATAAITLPIATVSSTGQGLSIMAGSQQQIPLVVQEQTVEKPPIQQQQQPQRASISSISSTGGRVRPLHECVEHLFPHIAETHRRIRAAIAGVGEGTFQQRMMKTIKQYISGCRDECSDVNTHTLKCGKLARSLSRTMDLIHGVCTTFSDSHEYLHRMSELAAIYISCELSYAKEFKEHKTLIANRISNIINKHLKVPNEEATKDNILRMFVYMPDMYKEREVMTNIFKQFMPKPIILEQRELSDKVYIQYLLIFYQWKQLEIDLEEQNRVIEFANRYMRPAKTLCANATYAYHLPKYKSLRSATRFILQNLKFFQDLRNASICDNCLTSATGVVDLSDDDPVTPTTIASLSFAEIVANTVIEPVRKSIKLEEQIVLGTVDLTLEEGTEHAKSDPHTEWLKKFRVNAMKLAPSSGLLLPNRQKNIRTNVEIIELDSDSEEEILGDHLEPELFSLDFEEPDRIDTAPSGFDDDHLSDNTFDSNYHDEIMLENKQQVKADPTQIVSRFQVNLRTYSNPKRSNSVHEKTTESETQPDIITSQCTTQEFPHSNSVQQISNSKTNNRCVGENVASSTYSEFSVPRIVDSFSCHNDSIHIVSTPSLHHNRRKSACSSIEDNNTTPTRNRQEHDEYEDDFNLAFTENSTETLCMGKVIYSQKAPSTRSTVHFHSEVVNELEYSEFEEHNQFKKSNIIKRPQQKKQVKFNENPIGPTRLSPSVAKMLPVKPAITSSGKYNGPQPIFSTTPLPNFNCPSPASTASTTSSSIGSEYLKQMAQREHMEAIASVFGSYDRFRGPKKSICTIRNASKAVARHSRKHVQLKAQGSAKRLTDVSESSPTSTRLLNKSVVFSVSSGKVQTPESGLKPHFSELALQSDPKLKAQCVVVIKRNEDIEQMQVLYINRLLELQREQQKQRALARQSQTVTDEDTVLGVGKEDASMPKLMAQSKEQATPIPTTTQTNVQSSSSSLSCTQPQHEDRETNTLIPLEGAQERTIESSGTEVRVENEQRKELEIVAVEKEGAFDESVVIKRGRAKKLDSNRLKENQATDKGTVAESVPSPPPPCLPTAKKIKMKTKKKQIEVQEHTALPKKKEKISKSGATALVGNNGVQIETRVNTTEAQIQQTSLSSDSAIVSGSQAAGAEAPLEISSQPQQHLSISNTEVDASEIAAATTSLTLLANTAASTAPMPPTTTGLKANVEMESEENKTGRNRDKDKERDRIKDRAKAIPAMNDNPTNDLTTGTKNALPALPPPAEEAQPTMATIEAGIIAEATAAVHAFKEAAMSFLNLEVTPTVPAYLFNGESRDVPTPPTLAVVSAAVVESPDVPGGDISDIPAGQSNTSADSSSPTSMVAQAASNTLINSTLSTSDHEVSSTQETMYELPGKRQSAVVIAGAHPKTTLEQLPAVSDSTTLLMQDNQVDTTNHLPETTHQRRRTRKLSTHDESTAELASYHHRPVHKRRKTFCAESSLLLPAITTLEVQLHHQKQQRLNNDCHGNGNGKGNGNGNGNGSANVSSGTSPSTTTTTATNGENTSKSVVPLQQSEPQKLKPQQKTKTKKKTKQQPQPQQKQKQIQKPATRSRGRPRKDNNVTPPSDQLAHLSVSSSARQRDEFEAEPPNCSSPGELPAINMVDLKHTYSRNNVTQVFVPPEIEECLAATDAETVTPTVDTCSVKEAKSTQAQSIQVVGKQHKRTRTINNGSTTFNGAKIKIFYPNDGNGNGNGNSGKSGKSTKSAEKTVKAVGAAGVSAGTRVETAPTSKQQNTANQHASKTNGTLRKRK